MQFLIAVLGMMLIATPAMAQRKSCDELKSEIEAKVKANGVKAFTLSIVPNDQAKDENVVGSCDGGTKKITLKID